MTESEALQKVRALVLSRRMFKSHCSQCDDSSFIHCIQDEINILVEYLKMQFNTPFVGNMAVYGSHNSQTEAKICAQKMCNR